MNVKVIKTLFAGSLLLLSLSAAAYIGPGAGVTALGALFGWIIGLFLAFFAILFYPFRWMFRRIKCKSASQSTDKTSTDSNEDDGTH